MAFDDPGWGGDDGFGTGGGHDPRGWGDHGKPPRQRPGWLNVQTLGGAAAVLLIVVAIVLAVTLHHSSKKKVATIAVTSRPAAASTSHPPTSASATPTPTVTGETIAAYDAAADKVCQAHASAIAGAGSTDLEAQYDALVDEFSDLETLTSPSQMTAKQEQWIQQLGDALTALTHHSESSYTTALQNADTTAATLGMTVCNNGY